MNTTNTTTNSLADVRGAADLFQFQTTTHLTPTHIMGIILIGLMAIMILWVLWSSHVHPADLPLQPERPPLALPDRTTPQALVFSCPNGSRYDPAGAVPCAIRMYLYLHCPRRQY